MLNKEELIRALEFIFEPIDGKFISFGETYHIYSAMRSSGNMENIIQDKYKEDIYPITMDTRLGELTFNLHSGNLNNLKYAIAIAYSYSGFHQRNNIDDATEQEIQKRIYS